MKRLAPLLVLLCAFHAYAEEPKGVQCGLFAVVAKGDAGARATYDGLRKGLELAHLPRVCMEAPEDVHAFLARVSAKRQLPVFAIGDGPAERLQQARCPRVVVLERYTVKGKPVRALPEAPGLAVVYADLQSERVQAVLGDLSSDPDAPIMEGTYGDLDLHLRWGRGTPAPYVDAVKRARSTGKILVSDDRGRFGQGAIVTLVPRHDLLGRAAAEVARKLRADPKAKLPPHAIKGFEVWVDLEAADEQGIALPLAFIAKADKLKRGKRH